MTTNWFLTICAVACSATSLFAGDRELLDAATAGNASSVTAIERLYARVEFAILGEDQETPGRVYEMLYWRQRDYTRIRQTCTLGNPGQVTEFEAGGGKQRALIRRPGNDPKEHVDALLIHKEDHPFAVQDPWKHALMGLPLFQGEPQRVESLTEGSRRLEIRRVTTESGPIGRLTYIKLGSAADTYEVWVDPKVNWLIRKSRRERKLGDAIEMEALDFTEVAPGVFFPATVRIRAYLHGKLAVTQRVVFSDVQINSLVEPPFPKRLPITAGMIATDELQGTNYRVDALGNAIGPSGLAPHIPDRPAPPAAIDPYARERFAWLLAPSTWLVILAILLLTTAFARVWIRRRQAARGY